MAAFVDSTVQDIDNRLRELGDDISKLKAARAVLAADGGARRSTARRAPRRRRRKPAAAAAATSTRRSTARRTPARRTPARRTPVRRGGRSATRATQTVALVRTRPGITIPELAKAMKIQPNYLYRVLPRLAADGQVRRDGKGWRVAS